MALQTQSDIQVAIQVKHTISSEYLSFKIIQIIGNLFHLTLHLAKWQRIILTDAGFLSSFANSRIYYLWNASFLSIKKKKKKITKAVLKAWFPFPAQSIYHQS